MSAERHIELSRVPSMARFYGRALVTRKPKFTAGLAPQPLTVRVPAAVIDAPQLAAYRRLFGFTEPAVPWTFPQVLAGSLNAELMLAPEFPFQLAGIIHLRSVIAAERPLVPDEPLALNARLAGHRAVKQGVEIDLETEVVSDQRVVWRSVNTVLARAAKPAAPRRAAPPRPSIEIPPAATTATWEVPADTGRRYARVSGDYNPIHLFGLTARLFGFRRPIAHGLWSLARTLAALGPRLPPAPLRIEVEFRRPLSMPATTLLASTTAAGEVSYALHDAARTQTFLLGRVVAAQPTATASGAGPHSGGSSSAS